MGNGLTPLAPLSKGEVGMASPLAPLSKGEVGWPDFQA